MSYKFNRKSVKTTLFMVSCRSTHNLILLLSTFNSIVFKITLKYLVYLLLGIRYFILYCADNRMILKTSNCNYAHKQIESLIKLWRLISTDFSKTHILNRLLTVTKNVGKIYLNTLTNKISTRVANNTY